MESDPKGGSRRDVGRDELVDLLREDSSDDDDDFFLHGPTKYETYLIVISYNLIGCLKI